MIYVYLIQSLEVNQYQVYSLRQKKFCNNICKFKVKIENDFGLN